MRLTGKRNRVRVRVRGRITIRGGEKEIEKRKEEVPICEKERGEERPGGKGDGEERMR
jgi:hypothetical protein